MTAQAAPPPLPDELKRLLPVARWKNVSGESGAQTWKSQKYILKVQPRGRLESLQTEASKLRWLGRYLPAPAVLAYTTDTEYEFLATWRLPGLPMHHPDALLHALRNADLLARALRELHALPIRECPFNTSLGVRLREARERLELGLSDGTLAQFNQLVRTRPAQESLVVTHGDPSLPNIMVSGEYIEGLIDVGRLGIADRHTDLAIACRSLRRNAGEEAAQYFLQSYGPHLIDQAKLEYYTLLDEFF